MQYISALLYNFILYSGFIVYFPYILFKMAFTGKYRSSFFKRLGFDAPGKITPNDAVIWLHAVSVGETLATLTFQKRLKETFPGHKLLFTVTTETGHAIALEKCKHADEILYFPLDFHFSLNRFLRNFNIKALVLTETEVWPNLVRIFKKREIPVIIINGRISDRSEKNYARFSLIFRPVFSLISKCLMQSDTDAARVKKLGAAESSVFNAGNIKYDEIRKYINYDVNLAFSEFGYSPAEIVFVAGSVHPGEDAAAVSAYKSALAEIPALKMIIAPRKLDKISSLLQALDSSGIKYDMRSSCVSGKRKPSESVMVLDTIGELARVYALAKAVFVGGSLVPVGGHNILEAAVFNKPVIFGNYMHNFREMSESFLKSGAGTMVSDEKSLLAAILKILKMPAEDYNALAALSGKEVERQSGAIAYAIEHIKQSLRP